MGQEGLARGFPDFSASAAGFPAGKEFFPEKRVVVGELREIRRITTRVDSEIRKQKRLNSSEIAGLLAESRYLLEKATRQIRQDELELSLYEKLSECRHMLRRTFPDCQVAQPHPAKKTQGKRWVKYVLLLALAYIATLPFVYFTPDYTPELLIIPTVIGGFLMLASMFLDAVAGGAYSHQRAPANDFKTNRPARPNIQQNLHKQPSGGSLLEPMELKGFMEV